MRKRAQTFAAINLDELDELIGNTVRELIEKYYPEYSDYIDDEDEYELLLREIALEVRKRILRGRSASSEVVGSSSDKVIEYFSELSKNPSVMKLVLSYLIGKVLARSSELPLEESE